MTRLRKMMLEELQRRNYSEITTRKYLQYVTAFARHFGKPPDRLGPNELRSYQAYLLRLLIENASDRVPLRCQCVLPEAFPIKPSDHPPRIVASTVTCCTVYD